MTWRSKAIVIFNSRITCIDAAFVGPSQLHSAWAPSFGGNLWVPLWNLFDLYALIQRRSWFSRWAPPGVEDPHLLLFMRLCYYRVSPPPHSVCGRYGSKQCVWACIYLHYSGRRRRSISGSVADGYSCYGS